MSSYGGNVRNAGNIPLAQGLTGRHAEIRDLVCDYLSGSSMRYRASCRSGQHTRYRQAEACQHVPTSSQVANTVHLEGVMPR